MSAEEVKEIEDWHKRAKEENLDITGEKLSNDFELPPETFIPGFHD